MRAIFRGRRPRQQLVYALGMIAGYNDKGADWYGHDLAQVQHFRQQIHEHILRLVANIGGNTVEDSSGSFTLTAQDELL